MDVTIRVTWADGSTSEHEVAGLPYDSAEAAQEVLEHKLADYLDPAELALDATGAALSWVAVELV
jgi:hypothetical protein